MHVAVSGKIASGKDTAAKIIINRLKAGGHRPRLSKFADRLYELCAAYDGARKWTEDGWIPLEPLNTTQRWMVTERFVAELESMGFQFGSVINRADVIASITSIAESTPTLKSVKNRNRLRGIAEYVRDTVDKQTWILFTAQGHLHGSQAGWTTVISDLRVLPEASWCFNEGIKTLRIDVDPEVQMHRMQSSGMQYNTYAVHHPTETELDTWEYFTDRYANNGTYEQLKDFVEQFVERHLLLKSAAAG